MHIETLGNRTYRLYWELPATPDVRRKRETRTLHGTWQEAQAAWAKRQNEIEAGQAVDPSRMTVRELVGRWLSDVKTLTVEASTLKNYQDLLRAHILPDMGHLRIQKVTAADLQAYYREKLQHGRRDGTGGLSSRTVRYLHNLLLAVFAQAVRWDMLQRNPAEFVEPPKLQEKEKHVWTEEEAAQFVETVSGHRLAAFWALAIVTGLREGELLGLRWRDVDLAKGMLTVAQALKRGDGPKFGPPKSRRSRRVLTLDEQTVAVLRAHRVRQAEERLFVGERWQDSGLVFTTQAGRPLMDGNMRRLHYKLCAKAGVPRIRPHDMRHTNATILFDRDTDPKTVQERLGHHSVSFTIQTYVHAIKAREGRAAQSIGDAVLGKKKPSAK